MIDTTLLILQNLYSKQSSKHFHGMGYRVKLRRHKKSSKDLSNSSAYPQLCPSDRTELRVIAVTGIRKATRPVSTRTKRDRPVSTMPNSTTQAGTASAPHPSPSASQPSQYSPQQPKHRHRTSLIQSQPQPEQQQASIPRSQPAETTTSPSSQKDFCMIAEAAKRAQMACLMRDMGEVTL